MHNLHLCRLLRQIHLKYEEATLTRLLQPASRYSCWQRGRYWQTGWQAARLAVERRVG